jgi:hypothetical protein
VGGWCGDRGSEGKGRWRTEDKERKGRKLWGKIEKTIEQEG